MRGKKSEARPVTLSKNLQHIYNNIDIIGKKSIFFKLLTIPCFYLSGIPDLSPL